MKPTRRRAGFTLIELMISVAVLAILVTGIYSALMASQNLYVTGVSRQEIQDRVRLALNEMALELRQGSGGTGAAVVFDAITSSAGDESVSFCMCTGFAGGVSTWSAPISYHTINGDDEADNGVDDNNNRRVDERKVIRIQAGRPDKIIADNVREGSLRFTRVLTGGLVNRITISLTLQGVDYQGRVLEASDSVTVDMRND